jgi:hypothetical protein
MIKKILLLMGMTLILTAAVSADMPWPPCPPNCELPSMPSN